MKKICFIVPSLGKGGAERVACRLLNNLSLSKYELTLLTIYKERGDYLDELREQIKFVSLEKTNIRYCVKDLYFFLKKEKFDIVVIFSLDIAIIIGLFILPFIKNTIFINRHLTVFLKERVGIIKTFLLKKAYNNFSYMISQSKDMTESLVSNKIISQEKITEINNPIEVKKMVLFEEKNLELKKENVNLIAVGRLSYSKGFDILVKNMQVFKNTNIKLYILGDGEEKNNLKNLIEEYNLKETVFLLGRKNNSEEYMKKASLFILSSRYEGFPNVLLEANSYGLFAICNTTLGGVNEIIENNVNGVILDFSDKKLFKKIVLEKLRNSPNKELVKNSVLKRYSMEKIIEKYEKLFDNVC